jgi:WD40 repeat protein
MGIKSAFRLVFGTTGIIISLCVCRASQDASFHLPSVADEPPRAIALSSDESLAVLVGGNFHALLQDPRPGYGFLANMKQLTIERELPKQNDGDSGVVIVDDGQSPTIVTSSYDGSVQLSKFDTKSPSRRIALDAGAITALASIPDGKSFVAAGYRGNQAPGSGASLVVCDANGNVSHRHEVGRNSVQSMSCSPDGQTIAVCDVEDGDVNLVDLKSGKRRLLRAHISHSSNAPKFFEDYANGVAFMKDGSLVVGGKKGDLRRDTAGWIELWDIKKSQIVRTVLCDKAVIFVATSESVIAAITGKQSSLELWTSDSFKPPQTQP